MKEDAKVLLQLVDGIEAVFNMVSDDSIRKLAVPLIAALRTIIMRYI